MVSDIAWDGPPPQKTSRLAPGLMGTDAYSSGKRWGQAAKVKYSAEDVARLIRKIGTPTNDHDRGALEGLTNA